MQFFLVNSSWLWLAALAAVPVLVHLFARSNPPKYIFSHTEFLHRVMKKTARFRKPQDWLILLLRTLAALAIILAFLQPLITSQKDIVGATKTTLFLIDRSASMSAKDDDAAEHRFSKACRKANELIGTGSIDEANIVWIEAIPDSVFPQPGPNLNFLSDELLRTQVRMEDGNIGSALRMALSQLSTRSGERELVIISDFQSENWSKVSLDTPPGITVAKVKVADEDKGNLAITDLTVSPPAPVIGQSIQVRVKVKNYSVEPRRTQLFLRSAGASQSQEVNLPEWSESELAFAMEYTSPGLIAVNASLSDESFAGDNKRHTIIEVKDTLKFVHLAQKPSPVLERVATSLPWLEYSVRQTPPITCDILFVDQWDGSHLDVLQSLSTAGTAVIITPGSGLKHEDITEFLDIPKQRSGIISYESEKDNPSGWKAGISPLSNQDSPVFSLFRNGEFGNPVEGVFLSRYRLSKEWPSSINRLLDYSDGIPALMRTRSQSDSAPKIVWNLQIDPTLSTWSQQNVFLPFFAELLLNSRASQSNDYLEILAGGEVAWSPDNAVSIDSVTLSRLDGIEIPHLQKIASTGIQLVAEEKAIPGVYQWKVGKGIVHQQVSNFPTSESDLRTLSPADIAGGEVIDSERLLTRAALSQGVHLWPWLVAFAFICLVAESLITLWKPKPAQSA